MRRGRTRRQLEAPNKHGGTMAYKLKVLLGRREEQGYKDMYCSLDFLQVWSPTSQIILEFCQVPTTT